MKIKQILLSAIAFFLPAIFMIGNVSAGSNDSNITYQKVDGAYFYMVDKNTGAVDTNYITKFYLNGKLSYCIEPFTDITTKIYNSTTNWDVTNLSKEQIEYIEQVGYFGYDYPSHKTDNYWLATQLLIWQKANNNLDIRITNGANGTGGDYNLTQEINEILSLMEDYKKLPSFANTTIEGNMGSELIVTDTNGVLSNFNMNYNGKHQVTKSGNTLNIKFADNEILNETITFNKTNYDNETTIIYYQSSSQKLAYLRISNPLSFTVNLKSNGVTVEVDKKGEELVYGNASYHYEIIQLPDVTFGIYANEDIKDSKGNIIYNKYQLVNTLKTTSDGIAILKDCYFGSYFITELESNLDNLLDQQKYYFELTKDDIVDGILYKNFDFMNYLAKGKLEFTKTDLVTGEAIPNTTIQIFTDEDRLIFTGTTDENGKIVIDNLFTGKFYMIEKNPATGYQLTNEVIYFEINEDGQIVKANMTNKKIEEIIVEVPNTGLNDVISVVAFICIVAGLFYLFYDKRKRK